MHALGSMLDVSELALHDDNGSIVLISVATQHCFQIIENLKLCQSLKLC